MTQRLIVWWNGASVGQLALNAHGQLEFTYFASWIDKPDATPVSASLPLRLEPFDFRATLPFFEGLKFFLDGMPCSLYSSGNR
ncbi:MAG: HipA N-terminal domain-containing protein [Aestuariivita sp.]|nr:HipA N-terminal domain-containing protein [Aestuariivita sp.]MCY4204062.1 HipA N-terminal domain-containing protein [Aestuariivita sp.]MCY4290088.1 HipA N-terminal domain-containing protein [Aestuariivita sp.]MCY4347984.1 HipA N-terminal domain-containing protein [Aestuariivita sp.]